MKAKITDVKYLKDFESKYGVLYSFQVEYDGKRAYYNSKKKDQTKFVKGQDAEFTETEKVGKNDRKYLTIKPIFENKGFSNYGKAMKKEQSRYSGFAVSYAKDLVVAGHLDLDNLMDYSSVLFEHMVALDKSLEA